MASGSPLTKEEIIRAEIHTREQIVIQRLTELHDVIRGNKQRNCAKRPDSGDTCNYEDPTPLFDATNAAFLSLKSYIQTITNRDYLTDTSYVRIVEIYNNLIQYAMHMFEPSPELPATTVPRINPTPMHSFIMSDTIPAKINFAKSQLFGYH